MENRLQPHYALFNLPIVGLGASPPEYRGAVSFVAYDYAPESLGLTPWRPLVIDDELLEIAHGICVVQWDGDISHEILTASSAGVYLFDFDSSGYPRPKPRLIGAGHDGAYPQKGSSEVTMGQISSQGIRFVVAIEPWHGNEVVVYETDDPKSEMWPRTVIDSTLNDGHAILSIDIDRDGNDEIVAGCRGGDKAIYLYQFAAENGEWERTLIDKGNMGAAGLFGADINQDGYADIVAIGTATHNVVWYENVWKASVDDVAP